MLSQGTSRTFSRLLAKKECYEGQNPIVGPTLRMRGHYYTAVFEPIKEYELHVHTAVQPTPWLDYLLNTQWSFGMAGSEASTARLCFNRDGRIEGYLGRNERTWRVENNVLKIYDLDGQPIWLFQPREADGEMIFVGECQRGSAGWPVQILRPLAPRHVRYRIASLANIQAQLGDARIKLLFRKPSKAFQAKACDLDASLNFSTDTPTDQRNITEKLDIPGAELWEINDATVFSRHGLIIIGNFIVAESLPHFPHHLFPMVERTNDEIVLPSFDLDLNTPSAYHATSGNLENYFHFFFDVTSKFCSVFMDYLKDVENFCVLFAEPKIQYQIDMLEIVKQIPNREFETVAIKSIQAISAQRLFYPCPCPASSLYPNDLTQVFVADFLRCANSSFAPVSGNLDEMIYVSRRDTRNRSMANEGEVEAALQNLGFRVVLLSGMPLSSQMSLFAGARLVVGPHGAGLTNLVFCKPGTSVIELHMKGNLSWVYRRVSQLLALDYDYLIGECSTTDAPVPLQSRRYVVDVFALRNLVQTKAAEAKRMIRTE